METWAVFSAPEGPANISARAAADGGDDALDHLVGPRLGVVAERLEPLLDLEGDLVDAVEARALGGLDVDLRAHGVGVGEELHALAEPAVDHRGAYEDKQHHDDSHHAVGEREAQRRPRRRP